MVRSLLYSPETACSKYCYLHPKSMLTALYFLGLLVLCI
jgi:hypothetical protein